MKKTIDCESDPSRLERSNRALMHYHAHDTTQKKRNPNLSQRENKKMKAEQVANAIQRPIHRSKATVNMRVKERDRERKQDAERKGCENV